jgi:ribosomal protein S27AE
MRVLERCANCGEVIPLDLPETNMLLKNHKEIVRCGICGAYQEVVADGTKVTLELVDELKVIVSGLREIAQQLEDGKIELVRSRHGEVKIPGRRGTRRSIAVGWKALEVVYK